MWELNQYTLPSLFEMHLTQPGGSFSSLDSNGDCAGDDDGDGDDSGVDVADEMEWTTGVDDDDDDDDDDDGNDDERDGMPEIGWAFPCCSCGLGLAGFKIEGCLSPLDGTTIGVNP